MIASPAKATLYFVRSIALAVVAGIIALAGLGTALVTNGEAMAAFVFAGIVAGVLLATSVISLIQGESALMAWKGIEARLQPRRR
jgi:hypothetical protein